MSNDVTTTENQNQPKLRFPGFKDNWDERRIDQLMDRIVTPVDVDENELYREIGIRSHGKGIFHKDPVKGKTLGNKRIFWIKENMFIVNIVFAWEQAVSKTTSSELGMVASHRFPMYKPKENILDLDFIVRLFLTKKGKYLLNLASPGGAGRNKTLGQQTFNKLKIQIPTIQEQQKIANFMAQVDMWLDNLNKQRKVLEEYKKGLVHKLFSKEIRFKDSNNEEFPEWQSIPLGECLDYEQPTKYIVKTTEYNNSYKTPVLTAGKSFILGYTNEEEGIFANNLPVIIFDDFTTTSQFVDFPFKVKSSAMKILKAKSGLDVKYIYEAMQLIKFKTGGHGRHWISKYSQIKIQVPSLAEQEMISTFLSSVDALIYSKQERISQVNQWKNTLMQQLFI